MKWKKGVVTLHSETGTEGGLVAFQDGVHIHPPTPTRPHGTWDREGLHILKNGDLLKIYDPKTGKLLFDDKAKVIEREPYADGGHVWPVLLAPGWAPRVRIELSELPLTDQVTWFMNQYPAEWKEWWVTRAINRIDRVLTYNKRRKYRKLLKNRTYS